MANTSPRSDWDLYRAKYADLQSNLAQATIVGLAAEATLADFPNNLPPHVYDAFASGMRALTEMLHGVVTDADKKAAEGASAPARGHVSMPEPIAVEYTNFMIHRIVAKRSEPPRFGEVARAQELVMMIAAVDAFLFDTVTIVCRARPGILNSGEKKISWRQILEAGDYPTLLQQLVDRFTYEAGYGALVDRLRLTAILGPTDQVSLTEDVATLIGRSDVVRNILMHSGGIVTSEAKGKARDLPDVGQAVSITREELTELSSALSIAAFEVFAAVSAKFFKVDRDSLGIRFGFQDPSAKLED